jgi:pimeloyl-ACP methyl ester carboxylesterase
MNHTRYLLSAAVILVSGCELWRPPPATPEEMDKGLVVMYPGVLNTTTEMVGIYSGLRDAGVDYAIEVVPWEMPLANFLMPTTFLASQRPWAKDEASRIAQYSAEHPGSPVTLLGYSGGAMMCIQVAEEMPENTSVDWIIMMAPGVSTTYDLDPMLEHTARGAVVYWSAGDAFTNQITSSLGTLDGIFGPPAASFGFTTKNAKLIQIESSSAFSQDGNDGGHLGYIASASWIRDFVAPGIIGGK